MPIEMQERIAFLSHISFFRGMDVAHLTPVAEGLKEQSFESDKVVLSQGKEADSLFLIYSGKVRVLARPDQPLEKQTVLIPENYFGEEALKPHSLYASTITAQEHTLLLVLSHEYFSLIPTIPIPDRVAFLSRIHLFHGLDETQLQAVANELGEKKIPLNTEIIKQGETGDRLYLIWSGKVRVTQAGKEKPLATFVAGDYFGEESVLVKHHRRTATVTSTEDTLVLVLTREQFNKLLRLAPGLRSNIAVTANSHHLERRTHFKWLQPDEVIYFLARKHPVLLARTLALPVIVELVAILVMILAWWYSSGRVEMQVLWYVALVVSVLAAGWGVWNGVDWGNDYYIVTNRRVVWLEKVIGIYDSRQEAPLSAIQRVNVTTELSGRILDYGNLVVRTIVGSTLMLNSVNHPYQAAALIEEHWKRSQESFRKMEEEDMRQALRTRLLPGQSKPTPVSGIIAKPPPKKNPYLGQRSVANLFRLRFEDKAVVTYRKHIFVLFRQSWQPGLILWILIGALVFELIHPTFSFKIIFTTATGGALLGFWFLLLIGTLLWWYYQYIDWSNDIFQVTPDQIMDIDKTPLGEVTSDIAALDNILSIEYERHGLLELIFNYGNVMITVGGGKQMVFEDVFNPSAVQEDIERRRLERISKKEQDRVKAERERMADWFAAYYHNEQRFRSDERAPGEKKPEDNKPEVK